MTVTDRYGQVPLASGDRDATVPEVCGPLVSQARGILSRVDDSFPWPADGMRLVSMVRYGLEEVLDVHGRLCTGELDPESEFPDLEHETDALKIALERVAEDVDAWAGALVLVVREHCGEEEAAYVSGVQESRSEH
jgi:hypothetical protein